MRWALVVVVVVGGCGRFDFDIGGSAPGGDAAPRDGSGSGSGSDAADAPADAAPCAFGSFTTPTTSAIVNSTGIDRGPALSHDRLTLTFSSDRVGATFHLFQSTRAAIGGAWSIPVQVTGPTGQPQDDPYLSADGLTLYWGGPGAVTAMTRTSIADPWQDQTAVVSDNAAFSASGGPDLSPDGLTLLFTSHLAADSQFHMQVVTRATTADAFGAASEPPGLANGSGDCYGSLSADLLEAFYSLATNSDGIHRAVRTSTSAAFGPDELVTEVNSPGDDNGDVDISDDGLELVFSSTRGGGLGTNDLWFATRSCL